MGIHPTALVDPKARIADGVEIGPYSVIGPDVTIGEGTWVDSHVAIRGVTTIGRDCRFYGHSCIGFEPQDLKYEGERTTATIGDRNVVREYVTIHTGTAVGGGRTVLGSDNYLMAYTHIAHDCYIGDHTIFANAATLAGHVLVADHATIGAFSGVHQHCRIGTHSYVGGYSVVTKDALPYMLSVGNRAIAYGVNVVGLKRKAFARDTVEALRSAYRLLRHDGLNTSQALERIESELAGPPEVATLVSFIRESERGVIK